MKKINSIGYGHWIVAAVAGFGILLPALLYGASVIAPLPVWFTLMKISGAIALLALLFLIILLTVELRQDRRANHYYEKNRRRKILLSPGRYECQACGSRNVRRGDDTCGVCGVRFQKDGQNGP